MNRPMSDLIMIEIKALGPVSFRSIAISVNRASIVRYDVHEIAQVLTALIREGFVDLYDTGDAFTVGSKEYPL